MNNNEPVIIVIENTNAKQNKIYEFIKSREIGKRKNNSRFNMNSESKAKQNKPKQSKRAYMSDENNIYEQ